jgi:hypothetical protein
MHCLPSFFAHITYSLIRAPNYACIFVLIVLLEAASLGQETRYDAFLLFMTRFQILKIEKFDCFSFFALIRHDAMLLMF